MRRGARRPRGGGAHRFAADLLPAARERRRARRRSAAGRRRSPTGSRAARRRGGSAGSRAGSCRGVVARDVDQVARPLQPEPLEPGDHVGRRLAGQDRRAADRVGLVGLRAVREQPPAPVLDRDRPAGSRPRGRRRSPAGRPRARTLRCARWTSWSSGRGSAGSPRRSSCSGAARACVVLEAEGVGAGPVGGAGADLPDRARDARLCALALEARERLARLGARARGGPARRRGARGRRRRGAGRGDARGRRAGRAADARHEIEARLPPLRRPPWSHGDLGPAGRRDPRERARSRRWPRASTVRARRASESLEDDRGRRDRGLRRARHAARWSRRSGSTSSSRSSRTCA